MLGGRFVILTYLGSYGPWIFPRNAQLAWALYKLDDNLAKTLSEPVSKLDPQKYPGAHGELEVRGEQSMQISTCLDVSWPPKGQSVDRLALL